MLISQLAPYILLYRYPFYRKLQDNIFYLQIIKHFIFIEITKSCHVFT